MADQDKSTPANSEEFLGLARKRFEAASEDEKHLRSKFVSDLKFASPDGDEQWDPQIKMQREAAGRPALSFPRCHTFVQQVANEARQNKPQIKFAPRLDADKDTAEIYEGLARYIQYASDAQIAYDTAIEYSAGGSFGYYRFLTDYCDDDTDDLDLKIVPVLDPLAIYGILVPSCFNQKPRFGFVVEEISKEEYKAKYGESEMASLSWTDAQSRAQGWVGSETVRIAEYWYCEETKQGGKRRPKTTVKFCKINGLEVLKDTETEWPGSCIPIVPVLGKQMIMEGKPHLFSVVRPQKSAQVLINYSKSRIAETLSTSPISPFIMVEGQVSGYEDQWKNMNTHLTPFLTVKAVDISGKPAPIPQRQTFEPPIQSLSAFVAQEVDDMKATTGIFDASLGQNGNETSGQAIQRRQSQANLTTMHFMDNLVRSFRKGGEIIAEVIPKVYDTEREIQILGIDEKPKLILINKEHEDEAGKTRNYDMTEGKYALVVTSGKAFDSKRSETFDTMQQVLATNPNLINMIGDIFFRNSDLAGSDQLAERFQKMLPPQLQENDNPLPPQAQAAVAHAQQQVQGMQAQLQQLTMEKQAKTVEVQGKLQQIQLQHQADMALEDKKLLTQITVAEIQTKAQIVTEREQALAKLESQFHDQAHDMGKQKDAHAHEAGMVAQKHANAADMVNKQAQNASDLADQTAQNAAVQGSQDTTQLQASGEQPTESMGE
ncbi:MAG: portal protein [Gemmatimonadales bacterium]